MQSRLCQTRLVQLALLVFSQLLVVRPAAGEAALSIALVTPADAVEIGVPFVLRLRLVNSGDEAFFVRRPLDFGNPGILVFAENKECVVQTPPAHFHIETKYESLLKIPLLPTDAVEFGLPAFNDLYGLDTLLLTEPGSYILRAVLASQEVDEGSQPGEIWHGRSVSPPIAIELLPASKAAIRERTAELEECLADDACMNISAIEYFRIVRDEEAAIILRKLLLRDHYINPRIAEAVARQGGREDVKTLEKVAAEASEPSVSTYFAGLAREIRDESGCVAKPTSLGHDGLNPTPPPHSL